jgi:hypothetical protein
VNPGQRLVDLIAGMPDGGKITTDPETAGWVVAMAALHGRQIKVEAYPSRETGILRASWEGPAAGEHHEVETWL